MDSKNECQDIVEELATAQAEEETAHGLRARDVRAPATLRGFAHTNQKGRNDGKPVALRREQCGISAESQNCEASRDSSC
jgi:hypothetical protein